MSVVIGATTPNRNDLISRVEFPVMVKPLPLWPGLVPSFISSTNEPQCIRHNTTSNLARGPPKGRVRAIGDAPAGLCADRLDQGTVSPANVKGPPRCQLQNHHRDTIRRENVFQICGYGSIVAATAERAVMPMRGRPGCQVGISRGGHRARVSGCLRLPDVDGDFAHLLAEHSARAGAAQELSKLSFELGAVVAEQVRRRTGQ